MVMEDGRSARRYFTKDVILSLRRIWRGADLYPHGSRGGSREILQD